MYIILLIYTVYGNLACEIFTKFVLGLKSYILDLTLVEITELKALFSHLLTVIPINAQNSETACISKDRLEILTVETAAPPSNITYL